MISKPLSTILILLSIPMSSCAKQVDIAQCDTQVKIVDSKSISQSLTEQLTELETSVNKECHGSTSFRVSKAEVLGGLKQNEAAKALVANLPMDNSPTGGRLLHLDFILTLEEKPNTDLGYLRSEKLANQYIQYFPDDYLGYMEMGGVFVRRDQPKEAFMFYNKAKSMVKPAQAMKFSALEQIFVPMMYNEGMDSEVYRIAQNAIKSQQSIWQYPEFSLIAIYSTNELGKTEEARHMLEELLLNNPAAKQHPMYQQVIESLSKNKLNND